jgi:hypothetical protein
VNRIRTKASIRNSRIRIEMTQGFYHIACVHVLKIFCCVLPFNNKNQDQSKENQTIKKKNPKNKITLYFLVLVQHKLNQK